MAGARKNPSDESGSSGSTAPSDLGIHTADGRIALPQLVPPSEIEAQYYYLGLPSKPRLVGRTSAGVVPWKKPANWGLEYINPLYDRNPEIRLLTPIGGPHRALHLIEGILPQVKDAIDVLPWTSIDLLRIGSSKVRMMERPVVLWVGVQGEKRVPWDNVALALRQVRVVLDSVRLTDVECEIRVANTAPLQSDPPPVFAPVVEEAFTGEWLAKRDISTSLGQAIVSSLPEDKSWEGTLGAYLRPENKPHAPVCALTCRHVCLPPGHHENEHYQQSDPAVQQHPVYAPSDKVLKSATRQMENALKRCTAVLQRLQTKQRNEHEEALFKIKSYERPGINRTLTQLRGMQPWENRQIGSVFYSPTISAPLGPDGKKRWTRDWCLLTLLRNKFPMDHTKNEVDLRSTAVWDNDEDAIMEFLTGACRLPPNFALPQNGLLPIAGVVPMAELEWFCSGRADRPAAFWCQPNTPEGDTEQARTEAALRQHAPPMFDREESRVLVVGKRGRTTGLTWGVAAEFQSLVRNPYGSLTFESRELAIIGTLKDKNTPFAAPGDSGSLVFDVTGRAVALLTAGSPAGQTPDVTYCSPLDLVLEDISKALGETVVLV